MRGTPSSSRSSTSNCPVLLQFEEGEINAKFVGTAVEKDAVDGSAGGGGSGVCIECRDVYRWCPFSNNIKYYFRYLK